MAAFSDFYPRIRLRCKGAVDETINIALLWAAREFCLKTWLFQETLEVQEIAGEPYYELISLQPNVSEVIGVKAVERDSRPLLPCAPEYIRQEEGEPRSWVFEMPNVLALTPFPKAASNEEDLLVLKVRVALQPKLSSPFMPDEIARRYSEALSEGAIEFLSGTPGELWTNPETEAKSRDRFHESIRHAKSDELFSLNPWGTSIVLNPWSI